MADDNDPKAPTDTPSHEHAVTQDADNWSVYVDANEYSILGFLQMCIERRFHVAVQERFKIETKLAETDYWIHTGVGGSPKMETQTHMEAPIYCYGQGARIMGWSAHGSKCGGFRPGTPDPDILNALKETLNRNAKRYPDARHLGLFAKEGEHAGDVEILVIQPDPVEAED